MKPHRFGPTFPRLFTAAILQELAFMLLVHFPGYLTGLGATEAIIGLLYSAAAFVAIVFRPALGRVLDLTHRRTVLLVTGALNTLVVFLYVSTGEWGAYLWVLFVLQRVSQIVMFTTMLTYGADSIPVERRTQGLAIFGLSGLIPLSIGGIVGDVAIDLVGFNGLFVLAAAAGFAAWLIIWTFPVLPVRGRAPRRGFFSAMVQKNLLPLWFVTLLFSVGLESIFTFTRTFVDASQIGTTGLFFGIYGVVAAVTRVLGGSRYDRMSHRVLIVGSIVLYGMGLGFMGLASATPMFVLAAIAVGTAHGAIFPLLSSEVVNRSRTAERGSAMSIFTSIFDISVLLGVPIIGFLIEGISYRVGWTSLAVVLIAGAAVYAFWDRRLMAASALVGEEAFE
ncbi:MAG: MFS transporter [Actinomycetota bacterium]|nr:MFS transporter [Actinomycetota bacterium]